MRDGHAATTRRLGEPLAWFARTLDDFVDVLEPLAETASSSKAWVAVERADGGFDLHRRAGRQVHFVSDAASATERQKRLIARTGVELRILPERVISTGLSIPAGGRQYLGQIVEHRLERLTPWNPDKVLYGYVAAAEPSPDGQVDVAFSATSREIAAELEGRLGALGVRATSMGSAAEPMDRPLRIDLFRGANDTRRRARRRSIGAAAIASTAGFAIACAIAAALSVATTGRISEVEANLTAARRALVTGTADTRQRDLALLATKRPESAVFKLIDRLSTIIPTTTYLDEMQIDARTMRLAGTSTEASTLIEVLESEPWLASARFDAPVTREADGRDRFGLSVERRDARDGGQ